jgi:hypothetical protein
VNDRLAISPRGAIELPVKIWTVVAGTISVSETPNTPPVQLAGSFLPCVNRFTKPARIVCY